MLIDFTINYQISFDEKIVPTDERNNLVLTLLHGMKSPLLKLPTKWRHVYTSSSGLTYPEITVDLAAQEVKTIGNV